MTAKSKGFKNTLFGEVDRRTLLPALGPLGSWRVDVSLT